ncbi:class I SAM-dependent methyltransferase [Actinoplanes subtropicus]|uniref:class I SAM-dependent methyltransferase n=1 Tax=Actinoplanes subtropicus TaxID=543632 RepID=UPI000551092A|nr:class I SAM-dependent methyltransferase [Actinoplanes subtropicus]
MRARYGIDAPGIVRLFAVVGVGLAALSAALFALTAAWWGAALGTLSGLSALTFLVQCGWMLYSSLIGKRRLWARTLRELGLRGDEEVLEAGPGRGSVLVAAARVVPAGHLVGVDIWRAQDQSGNGPDALLANARAAGVAGRVEALDGDMRELPFPDAAFDLALASLAIHNLPPGDRPGAVRELLRVVRPGGRIVILDFQATSAYAGTLREGGAADVRVSGRHWSMHPPVRVVTATAP